MEYKISNLIRSMHLNSICFVFSKLLCFIFLLQFLKTLWNQGSRVNGRSHSKNGCEKAWNGNLGWFLFRVNGPPPPNFAASALENGMDLTRNTRLAVNEIPRSLLWIIILCLLAFFATYSTTTLLLFILINGEVQAQRNVKLVGYPCAGEMPTFCKIQTGRNG